LSTAASRASPQENIAEQSDGEKDIAKITAGRAMMHRIRFIAISERAEFLISKFIRIIAR
jgi:hypothetical protein